jgi:hypothetical protein
MPNPIVDIAPTPAHSRSAKSPNALTDEQICIVKPASIRDCDIALCL